jgi:threonylcarbamoyladenosine tRNA methylthiotransferase MtaB
MKTTSIYSMGCRLNAFETEVMREHIEKSGIENLIVVNSCAVTQEAEREARQIIRRSKRKYPQNKIIVTGCAAQINPDLFAQMPEVDSVIGNLEKLDPEFWSEQATGKNIPGVRVNDIMSVKETAGHMIEGFQGRARAFVEVQKGCDHRCTFCIIPFGRGPSRSVPAGEVIKQINLLVAKGFNEVVLTGVDLTDYGKGLPGHASLGELVARILKLVPDLKRLRLSSLDPIEIDTKLLALFADEPRLLPQVHLSIQSGDNMILKRMKRRHQRRDVLKVCEKLREIRPDIVFGADIIAGFPTETERMFENTRSLIKEASLTQLHVFPYSPRIGTPAERMPQVHETERKYRAKILREEGEAQFLRCLDSGVGSEVAALIERDGFGHSEHFMPVRVIGNFKVGDIIRARVKSREGKTWIAEPLA